MTDPLKIRNEERAGPHFSPEKLLAARDLSQTALRKIMASLEVGMSEPDARARAQEIMSDLGAATQWHKINIRMGPNTVKSFRELSEPNVVLQSGDIAYVDIGPVWDGFEGDAGESLVIGKNERLERLASDSRDIFSLAAEKWKHSSFSGDDLFRYCEQEAIARGWQMVGRHMSGHRLSDFPHAAYHRGTLADASFELTAYAWVLEVTLLDPQTQRGAFFEDLLF